MRRWRMCVGSVALLMAVACVTEVDDDRGAEWYVTSASASASVGSAGSTGGSADTGAPEPGSSETDEPDEPSTSGASSATTSDPSPTTDPGSHETTGSGGSGDAVLDECLALSMNACEECGCTQCLDALHGCQLEPGCVAIRDCAQQSGCTDAASCYEACEDVINANGGAFGEPVALAGDLAECMETSCPVCF